MNYNSMTDLELLHYLDLYSEDPLIRRVVSVISNTRGALINDLEHAGMDTDTWMFRTDWQSMYPGEYIIHLRHELENTEQDLDCANRELEEIKDKYDELKTRNIMQFIEDVRREQRANQDLVKDAMATVKAFKDENERLKEQINMWGRLNQVKQGV